VIFTLKNKESLETIGLTVIRK